MLFKIFKYKDNDLAIFPNYNSFIEHATKNWIKLCNSSIKKKGNFFVALSGGSTPKKIYEEIIKQKHFILDTSKIFLFWSDERCVSKTDIESNYFNAMSALSQLNIPEKNIFRMHAEQASELAANNYENLIKQTIPQSHFDLIMLGVGEDGHIASLFPHTNALNELHKLVTINNIPQKHIQRMTLTYLCLKKANNIYIYVTGENKSSILQEVFTNQEIKYPVSHIISNFKKNTWFIDDQAGKKILPILNMYTPKM